MITKFELFLEALFSGINFDDLDYDTMYEKPEFNYDGKLLQKIYLKKFNQSINLNWYDTETHPFKEKIRYRTSALSISDFNEIIERSLLELFDKYIDKLLVKMSDKKTNRIAVEIHDLATNLIIDYDVDIICGDNARMSMLSVVPKVTPITVNRTFILKGIF